MTASSRKDGRQADQLRPVSVQLDASAYAEGSCLISAGNSAVFAPHPGAKNISAFGLQMINRAVIPDLQS